MTTLATHREITNSATQIAVIFPTPVSTEGVVEETEDVSVCGWLSTLLSVSLSTLVTISFPLSTATVFTVTVPFPLFFTVTLSGRVKLTSPLKISTALPALTV